MKKTLLVTFTFILAVLYSSAQNFNISLLGQLQYTPTGNADLANIGGYVDTAGNEYALVGWQQGLSIVDVTNPANPVQLFNIPGPNSIWREVKTYLHYAYVTTEGGGGLQIIDLSSLPGTVPVYQNYLGDSAIAGQLDNIHSLHIEGGYVYLHGSNLYNGAAVICDLNADPWNPHFVGHTPGTYVHDGYARGNLYYPCHVYDGYFSILDVTNKANPVLLGQQTTPGFFTHNCWLSTNGNYLFTTDEVSNSYLASYDVTNPANIQLLDKIQITPGSGSIVHNTHIVNKNGGDFAVSSWYRDGVVITDVTRPGNMINTGWYDTYTQGSGSGFDGDWGVYPFLPSGNLVVSDINNGLFVLGPTYVRACYLEGKVTDSITGLPINNALVEILGATISKNSMLTGDYKTGTVNAGTYTIRFSRSGYVTDTIYGVTLANGVVDTLNVKLFPLNQILSVTGQVLETGTNTPIANAQIHFSNASFAYDTISDVSGNFNIPAFFAGSYDITVGKWGHVTYCTSGLNISSATIPLTFHLDNGWYDDFSFDFGWTKVSQGSNNWERAIPVGTFDNGQPANPGADVTTDCLNLAYVTDNGGGGPFDHDVDPADGIVTLTSPTFDLTSYASPQLQYYRWFVDRNNQNGNPNDTMLVQLSNGITTVTLETLKTNSAGNGTWLYKTWNVQSLIAPTANMQMILKIWDNPPGNVVEGGLDKFQVTETVGITETNKNYISLIAQPNPFSGETNILYSLTPNSSKAILTVSDIAGKIVQQINLDATTHIVSVGKNLAAGIYTVRIDAGDNKSEVVKVVKK